MPSSARRAAVRAPMPQIAVTGRSPIVGIHVRRVSASDAAGLGEPGRRLGLQLGLADPDRAATAACRSSPSPARRGRTPRGRRCATPRNASSQPHTSTTTPERPQRRHHLGRRRVVGGAVRRQEHGVGAPARRPCRAASPSGPRTHAPRTTPSPPPGAAGSGRRRRPRRPAGRQLRPPQHLDRGQELVEVDVQDPRARSCCHRERWFPGGHHHTRWHAGSVWSAARSAALGGHETRCGRRFGPYGPDSAPTPNVWLSPISATHDR